MSRITSFTLIGAGLLSLGTVAIAQTQASPAPSAASSAAQRGAETRQPMDRATLQARLAARFDAADKNRDGSLSVEERRTQRTENRDQMRDRMFARLDTNKDGTLSKDEFNARREGVRRDGDHRDGARRDHVGRDHAGRDDAREGKRERSAAGARSGHAFHGGAMMSGQLAEYRDKPIPRAAYIAAGLTGFDRIDTDRDGKISATERDAARKAMSERRKASQS